MSWIAFHFHYHADLDRLLAELIRPLLAELVAAPRIDRFFFVRYAFGGPHLRLRLRLLDGQEAAVRDAVIARAAGFFHESPSPQAMPAEEIRRINQSILATDASEQEDAVHPDNCARERLFEPETERYGGATLLPYSLDYFTLSSARALRFLGTHGGTPRARQLPLILRMLLGEALGFAADGEELLALLAAPFEGQPEAVKTFMDRGDRLFAEQKEAFCRLLRADVEAHLGAAPPAVLAGLDLFTAARELAASWASTPAATRLRISGSQTHMSANRLGLRNPEEVYLGRVLWLAARELRTRDDALWGRLQGGIVANREVASQRLGARAERAIVGLDS